MSLTMKRQVLVTGGAGFIGSHALTYLIDQGYRPVVVDNLSTGFSESIPSKVDFIKGDLRNPETLTVLEKSYRFDSVMHFAAKLSVSESVSQPLEYFDNNVGGTLQLLKFCKKNRINKFIFSSSGTVYGECSHIDLLTEDSNTLPINPYGVSKLACEKMIKACESEWGMRFIILRYFNVAGASDDLRNGQRSKSSSQIIKAACEAALGLRSVLNINGSDYPTLDGTCIRDYVHVEDLVEAHAKALTYLEAGGTSQVFNCGYGKGYSVLEVVNEIKKISESNFKLYFGQRRPGDPSKLVADSTQIRNILDWKPKRARLSLICRSSYNWEKAIFQNHSSNCSFQSKTDFNSI